MSKDEKDLQMLKLYQTATSVCSIKVRYGLAEIGLGYDSVLLNFPSGEQHEEAYLKINPAGVVPTLIDGDLVVVESSLILEYLDMTYNGSKLMPQDRRAAVAARHWLVRTLAIHAAINTLTFSTAAREHARAHKSPEEIAASIAKMPDPVMRQKRADLMAHGLKSLYLEEALGQLRRTFSDMNAALQKHAWVTGADFGIADVALLSYIDRLHRLGFEGLWTTKFPQIESWLKRMQSRPAYETAVTDLIDAKVVARTRRDGEKHWPELERLWTSHRDQDKIQSPA
jgi:glutathione S-transferase